MEYLGLLSSYPLNRPLSVKEQEDHLPQKKKSYSKPHYQGSVIKMNSTYLECVDKFFEFKGFLTSVIGTLCCIFIALLIALQTATIIKWQTDPNLVSNEEIIFLVFVYVCVIPFVFVGWKFFLNKELFRYTHYPIRFNRKTRMVHVFRVDGTIMSELWEKLYFTLGRTKDYSWEVRGHKLAKDGVTVLETFALPFIGQRDADAKNSLMWSQWEFVREYMEGNPEELKELAEQVELVMEVSEHRETFWNGFQRVSAAFGFMWIIMIPISFWTALGRWLANQTSKIPKWSPEIEAESQIDPDDPIIRDAEHLAVAPILVDDEEESDFRK